MSKEAKEGGVVTFKLLNEIIEKNNIRRDVHLMSNSGWECSATEMNGVFYYEENNMIIFGQSGNEYEKEDFGGKLLYSEECGLEVE